MSQPNFQVMIPSRLQTSNFKTAQLPQAKDLQIR